MATTDFDLLVVGDANPDVILAGAPRHPAFGQREQLVDSGDLVLGGSGAITAHGAARLGLRTAFVGRVGDDAASRFVLDALRRAGVDVSACVVDPSTPTAITVVLVDRAAEAGGADRADRAEPDDHRTEAGGADRAILTAPGTLDRLEPRDVPPELLRRSAHLHVSSFFLQPELAAGLPALFAAARAAGRTTSLDTNDDPSGRWLGLTEVLPLTDVLLPNDREALAIAGRTDGDVERAARDLAARGTTPVIKCGGDGALSYDGGLIRVPAVPARVTDTVGAGDSFNAGLLAARLRGLPPPRCLAVAVACGTLSTRAAGGTAAQPTWEDVVPA